MTAQGRLDLVWLAGESDDPVRRAPQKANGAGAHVAKPNGKSVEDNPSPEKRFGKNAKAKAKSDLNAGFRPSRGRTAGRIVAAIALGATGLALSGVTAGATVAFSYESAGTLMSGLAAASDATAMLTPAAACALWRARRWLLASTAWAMWAAASCICLSNLAGFIGQHGDQFFGQRETAALGRDLTLERVARLRSERASISESRSVGEINAAINNASAKKIDAERIALQTARHRDEIDRQLAGLEPQLAGLPTVSTIDPSAAILADALHLPSVDLRRARLCLLLGLPLCGGWLIAVAFAVGTGATPERRP